MRNCSILPNETHPTKTLFGLIYPTILTMCLALSTASHATVYTYDELHRLTRVTDPSGYRLDYRYDPAGNLLKITASQITTSLIHHLLVGTTDSQVLIRSPDGTLENHFTVNPSPLATMLATMDSDQNNTAEVVVASENAITLYDLKGVEQRTFPVVTLSATLAIGDFNQDGQPEIAVASQVNPSRSASFYSLIGNPLGEISLFPTETLFSLAVGDVDKDGHNDLIAGNLKANEISVQGRFTFSVFRIPSSNPPSLSANQIIICHRPPGQPNAAQTLTISKNAWPAHQKHGDSLGECTVPIYGVKVAVADLDGDGQAEIIAAMASNGSQIEIYRSDGTLLRKFEAFESNTGLVVTAGQVINDSRPEIVVSELNGTIIRLFDSTGQLLTQVLGTDSGGIVSLAVGSEVVEMSVEQ